MERGVQIRMTEKEIRSALDDIHSDILKVETPIISFDLIESIQNLIKEKNGQVRRLKKDIKIYEQVVKDSAEGYRIRIAAERRNTIDEFSKKLNAEIDCKATRTTQKALLETIIEKTAKEMKGDNKNGRKTV